MTESNNSKTKELLLGKVLLGIVMFARTEILKYYGSDSCIASTKVVIRILKHFGFQAEPRSVQLIVHNAAFNNAVLIGDTPPPTESPEFQAWFKRTGAYSVGIGVPHGHLVAILENVLIDASVDQAARPQWGIDLPKVLVTEFQSLPHELIQSDTGATIIYRESENNDWWCKSPNWLDYSPNKKIVKSVIRHIEQLPSRIAA